MNPTEATPNASVNSHCTPDDGEMLDQLFAGMQSHGCSERDMTYCALDSIKRVIKSADMTRIPTDDLLQPTRKRRILGE